MCKKSTFFSKNKQKNNNNWSQNYQEIVRKLCAKKLGDNSQENTVRTSYTVTQKRATTGCAKLTKILHIRKRDCTTHD